MLSEQAQAEIAARPRAVMVAYGGGVNSVALLILLSRTGVVPKAIVMADPGSERVRTTWHRDEVMPAWLAAKDFPPITVIRRAREGRWRARTKQWKLGTLADECARTASLPSAAYGMSRCSAKYKAEPARWWSEEQAWANREWLLHRKVVKAMGYDLDEPGRIRTSFDSAWENERFEPWYPLFEAKMGREECEELIAAEGLPSPGKSACTFCPNSSLGEWETLRREEPQAFADAVEMSRRAAPGIESESVGLMRCFREGKRQLHLWADGLAEGEREVETQKPCECAL